MPGSPKQEDFAKLVGIGRNTVTRYETDTDGSNKPIVLIRWAEVTGYDLNWLMYGDDPLDETAATGSTTGEELDRILLAA